MDLDWSSLNYFYTPLKEQCALTTLMLMLLASLAP